MNSLFLDLRFAFRQLRKSPGFTATAVLTLALGIGATITIFSIVEGILLRPLPFRDPSRLVILSDHIRGVSVAEPGVNTSDIRTYTRSTGAFSSLSSYKTTQYELSGPSEPAEINVTRLSGNTFQTLGVSPLLGRVFTRQEDDEKQQVTVLSYATWKGRFQSDSNIIGKKLLLDRQPYLIIGVMPRDFEFPLLSGHLNQSELWIPLSLTPAELTTGAGLWGYRMVGRLKSGITVVQAQADAEHVTGEIMRNYPSRLAAIHIDAIVRPLREDTVDERPFPREPLIPGRSSVTPHRMCQPGRTSISPRHPPQPPIRGTTRPRSQHPRSYPPFAPRNTDSWLQRRSPRHSHRGYFAAPLHQTPTEHAATHRRHSPRSSRRRVRSAARPRNLPPLRSSPRLRHHAHQHE